MKAKIYVGAKKYALYIGRKIVEKTLEFLSLPARFVSNKVQELKNYLIYGKSVQSNLPDGYTQLEYIESTGEQYIVTDFFFDDVATDTLTCDFMRTTTGKGTLLYGFRDAYKVNSYGFQFNDQGRTYRQYGDSDTGLGSTYVKNLNTRYTVKQTGYAYIIGGSSSSIVAPTPVQNYPLVVFAIRNADLPATTITPMRVYNLNVVTASGNVILNLVPVKRNSDDELGLYDTVTGKFYTNVGTGSFIAGDTTIPAPTPSNPIEIKSVGDRTKNIFNKSSALLGYGIGATGIIAPSTQYNCSNYVEVKPNTTYIRLNNMTPLGNYYHLYDKDKNWIERRSTTSTGLIITSENTKYIAVAITLDVDLENYQIVEGDTATPYEPYGYKVPVVIGDTTTNIYLDEPLRKLGDLTDYIDYENQKIVRNVEELILDGNEEWLYYNVSGVGKLFRTVADTTLADGTKIDLGVICDKYKTVAQSDRTNNTLTGINRNIDLINNNFSDVTSWKRELTNNNVKVYYPLATPTEETIYLPAISLPSGTVTIDTDTEIKPSKIIITGDIDNE